MNNAKILELAWNYGLITVIDDGKESFASRGNKNGILTTDLLAFARLVAAAERERAARIVDSFLGCIDCDMETEADLLAAIRSRTE